ncbi:MAG: hypothetical protein EXR45_04050 [Chloroflexi bacterium]|nr:hypothetical protein [Chloroflexota bacterium]
MGHPLNSVPSSNKASRRALLRRIASAVLVPDIAGGAIPDTGTGTTVIPIPTRVVSPSPVPALRTPEGPSPSTPSTPLAEARAMRLDGDYRNAYLAFHGEAMSSRDRDVRALATLGSAETLLTDRNPGQALEILDEWIDTYPEHPQQYTARCLRARSLELLGPSKRSDCVTAYREALYVANPAHPEVLRVRIANHLFALGQASDAWQELQLAASGPTITATEAGRLVVLEALNGRYAEARDPVRVAATALASLDAAALVGRIPEELAEIAWRAVTASMAIGDNETANLIRWRIVTDWPETPTAFLALTELGSSTVPAWARARIAITNSKWQTARDALDWLLANSPTDPNRGRIRAMRAVAANALGDPGARVQLDASAAEAPGDRWGARALWEAAESRRDGGDLAGASIRYAKLATDFPGSTEAARALYRLGRLLPELGDVAAGNRAMNGAADLGPIGFHTYRARAILGRRPARSPSTLPAFIASGALTESDRRIWDDWLATRSLISADARTGLGAPDLAKPLTRLESLLATGFVDEAEDAAREVCQLRQFSPSIVASVAARVQSGGHIPFSMSLGHRLLRILADAGEASLLALPNVARKLAYPLAYGRLVGASAARSAVDPYLVMAVMKQESWFRPEVTSAANARGLTQFIRPTAESVARELNWPNWNWDDMTRPYVSVPFGAHHIAQLIDMFRGNVLFAIASYNAGPGPILKWANGDYRRDDDLFVEGITYRETREYVTSVATYAECYREIYGVN